MDVREKLVELLTEFYGVDPMYHGVDANALADHLIAHGVTVQDNTQITDELLKQLRNAPVTVMTEEPTIETVQEWIPVTDVPWLGEDIAKLCIRYMTEYADFRGYASQNKVKAHIIRLLQAEADGRITIMPEPPKGE